MAGHYLAQAKDGEGTGEVEEDNGTGSAMEGHRIVSSWKEGESANLVKELCPARAGRAAAYFKDRRLECMG